MSIIDISEIGEIATQHLGFGVLRVVDKREHCTDGNVSQGTPPELPAWKEKHQPKHQLDPDRGCQQH